MRFRSISKVCVTVCVPVTKPLAKSFVGREVTAVNNVPQMTAFFGGFVETRPLFPALMEKKADDKRLGASGIGSFLFLVNATKVAEEEGLVMSQ